MKKDRFLTITSVMKKSIFIINSRICINYKVKYSLINVYNKGNQLFSLCQFIIFPYSDLFFLSSYPLFTCTTYLLKLRTRRSLVVYRCVIIDKEKEKRKRKKRKKEKRKERKIRENMKMDLEDTD